MSAHLAALAVALGIAVLFSLENGSRIRTSWAIWLPMAWIFLSASRPISEWMNGFAGATSVDSYQQGNAVDALGYAVLLAGALAVLAARQRAALRILGQNKHIVLFILFCAVSIAWSEFPVVALKRWIKSLGDYSMILVMLTEVHVEAAVSRVLARVSFLVIPLSILFIKYFPDLGRTYAAHWDATQFYVGVCDNKNMLGMVCLVFGIAAWCHVLEAWKGPRRERRRLLAIHGTVFLATMWLLLISDSKTSLSCFVLASSVVTAHAFVPAARRRASLNALVLTVVLFAAMVLFLGVGGGALKAIGRNSTLTGRTEIWSILLSTPTNPLLGTGFESFWLGPRLMELWSHPILNTITEAHDGYLEMYLNLGWAGVAILLVLLGTGYRNILRVLRRDAAAGRLRLALFVAALIYDYTEAGFRSTDLVWIATVLAIMLPPARTRASTAPKPAKPVPDVIDEESILLAR